FVLSLMTALLPVLMRRKAGNKGHPLIAGIVCIFFGSGKKISVCFVAHSCVFLPGKQLFPCSIPVNIIKQLVEQIAVSPYHFSVHANLLQLFFTFLPPCECFFIAFRKISVLKIHFQGHAIVFPFLAHRLLFLSLNSNCRCYLAGSSFPRFV